MCLFQSNVFKRALTFHPETQIGNQIYQFKYTKMEKTEMPIEQFDIVTRRQALYFVAKLAQGVRFIHQKVGFVFLANRKEITFYTITKQPGRPVDMKMNLHIQYIQRNPSVTLVCRSTWLYKYIIIYVLLYSIDGGFSRWAFNRFYRDQIAPLSTTDIK